MKAPIIDILLIEDNEAEARLILAMLDMVQPACCVVQHVVYLADALEKLKTNKFDIVLVDLGLPDSQGLETALAVRKQAKETAVVVLTVLDDAGVALKSLEMDIQDYLIKSELNSSLLYRSIRYAIQRERLAREIEQLNVDLKTANAELEAFNFTVAHDLRQPLNMISSHAQAVKMICYSERSQECRDYVEGIHKGVSRMSGLIDALLQFSRMTHTVLTREMIDVSVIVHEVAEELKAANPERRVDFRIADGIKAFADAKLLRIVLDNLIGNAWKYSTGDSIIEFGVTGADGERAYFVRDNGRGFDMTYVDQLFVPFKRLPDAGENRGFGVGLATVARIIERHGGRVWAEGEPDKGATFYFTIPNFDA